MKDWGEQKELGSLYEIGSSKRVLKSQWKTSGVPFYRGREVTRLAAHGFVDNELFISEDHFSELSRAYGVPKADDIIITAIGTIGNAHVVRPSDRFYFKDASVLWMKRIADVSSEFVHLWLKSPLFFEQLDRGNGATVDTLTIQKLQSVKLYLPPFSEQQRIVSILDKAFQVIATSKANVEKNLQNARALFDSHLDAVFDEHCKNWPSTKLDDVTDLITCGVAKRPEYVATGVPFLSAKNVKNGRVIWSDYRYVSEQTHLALTKHNKPRMGDVLYTRVGSYGEAAIVDRETEFSIFVSLTLIKPKAILLNSFLKHYLNSSTVKQLAANSITGVGVGNLNVGAVRQFPIHLPPMSQQHKIVAALDEIQGETQRLESTYQRKLAAVEELKKSLLHQAFSGQL